MSLYQYDSVALSRLQDQISFAQRQINELKTGTLYDRGETGIDKTLNTIENEDQLYRWENKLIELETLLHDFLHTKKKNSALGVQVGDYVKFKRDNEGVVITAMISKIGKFHQDIKCISPDSPLGTALLGKIPGARVSVDTPSGIQMYTLLEIER